MKLKITHSFFTGLLIGIFAPCLLLAYEVAFPLLRMRFPGTTIAVECGVAAICAVVLVAFFQGCKKKRPAGGGKRGIPGTVAGLLCGIFVLFAAAVGYFIFGDPLGLKQIKALETQLQKPAIYHPVAETLVLYCQSDVSLFPGKFDYSWLPAELKPLGVHPYYGVTPDSANVGFGGGFYHFGYRIERDAGASAPGANTWHVFLYREDSPDQSLETFSMPSDKHMTTEELKSATVASLDESIKEALPNAYRNKAGYYLKTGDPREAAAICDEWVNAEPDDWMARLTRAHVRCRLGEAGAAAKQFAGWVDAHPNFAYCIYLAVFLHLEDRTPEALQAVRMALDQPLVEPDGTEGNKFYLGENGALIAYYAGNYDLAVAMCDKMLADRDEESYWLRKTERTKAAAMFMKGDLPAAVELMKQAMEAGKHSKFGNPGEVKNDEAMLDAIKRNDASYVSDPGKWTDDQESWFNPYYADEIAKLVHPPSWQHGFLRREKEQQ